MEVTISEHLPTLRKRLQTFQYVCKPSSTSTDLQPLDVPQLHADLLLISGNPLVQLNQAVSGLLQKITVQSRSVLLVLHFGPQSVLWSETRGRAETHTRARQEDRKVFLLCTRSWCAFLYTSTTSCWTFWRYSNMALSCIWAGKYRSTRPRFCCRKSSSAFTLQTSETVQNRPVQQITT